MPTFKRLTEEEIAALEPRRRTGLGTQRRELAETYRENLSAYQPGDWVEVALEEGEKRDTVKMRLKRVAKELGMQLAFRRTRGDRLRFQINGQGAE